nr:MAG TPA: hypothetical protein [Caudoviricetes sp.]
MKIERLRTLLGILQEAHGIPKSKSCVIEKNGGCSTRPPSYRLDRKLLQRRLRDSIATYQSRYNNGGIPPDL